MYFSFCWHSCTGTEVDAGLSRWEEPCKYNRPGPLVFQVYLCQYTACQDATGPFASAVRLLCLLAWQQEVQSTA